MTNKEGHMARFAAYLLIVSALLLMGGCDRAGPRVRIGEPLPEVALTSLDGKKVSLPAAYRGSVVVVLFWEKDCPYCAVEMPLSERIYRKYRESGFVFVALNVGNKKDDVEDAVSGMDITYPVLLDPGAAARKRFGIRGLPTMFFLDREGLVTEKILGGLTTEMLDAMVAEKL